jgi:HAD superfamily phosphatase (TIGR01668 family)
MRFSLLPGLMAQRVTDLSPEMLKNQGIQLLMLDFDNTLIPYTTDIPTDAVLQWLQTVQESGIRVCIVSNSKKPRVRVFCEKYGLPCVTHAKKPFSRGIRQCMERFEVPPSACALVGDQIYTDTLGANCAGIRSILVKAIHNHTFWLKLRHVAEKPFIFAARKRRIDYEKH